MYKNLFISLFLLTTGLSVWASDWHSVGLHTNVTHVQPMTGLVLWPDEAEDRNATYGKSIQLEFSYCLPCKVVKGCDADGTIIYDWTWFDTLLADVASRGHQLVARFRYEYPSGNDVDNVKGSTAVPQYIKNLPDYSETYNKVSGDGPTYYADWSNSELKRFTKQFYTDFAARYSNDPRLAFLEVGFGHWSEYHIYGTKLQLGKNFPTHEYQKEFFLHLATVMKDIPWAMSIDAADEGYTPFHNDNDLHALTFGLFDDSFMHKDHEIGTSDGYNEECWRDMGTTRWHTGVCGGEISYYKDSDQKNFLNPAGMYGHTWEEQATKYHITFMIANDFPSGKNNYTTPARFKEASMATGYHFVVEQCTTDGTETRITVKNSGVAPLYRDAFFTIGQTRSEQSLRGLLPGKSTTISIPAAIVCDSNGDAITAPEIVSDNILPSQRIEYDSDILSSIKNTEIQKQPDKTITSFTTAGIRTSAKSRGIKVVKGRKTL